MRGIKIERDKGNFVKGVKRRACEQRREKMKGRKRVSGSTSGGDKMENT